jgi:Fur family transcriptional regulator, zinc uptake regulator
MSTDAHTAHAHHEPTGAGLADAARASLESAGEQWTDLRAGIFAVLADEERPSSAYDIAEKVSARRGKRVAANTVYRILDLFVTNNLAQRVESANAYVVNAHPGCLHDCIFLVCRSCGEATHLDNDRVTGQVRGVAASEGFATERPVIEVLGTCAKCG